MESPRKVLETSKQSRSTWMDGKLDGYLAGCMDRLASRLYLLLAGWQAGSWAPESSGAPGQGISRRILRNHHELLGLAKTSLEFQQKNTRNGYELQRTAKPY